MNLSPAIFTIQHQELHPQKGYTVQTLEFVLLLLPQKGNSNFQIPWFPMLLSGRATAVQKQGIHFKTSASGLCCQLTAGSGHWIAQKRFQWKAAWEFQTDSETHAVCIWSTDATREKGRKSRHRLHFQREQFWKQNRKHICPCANRASGSTTELLISFHQGGLFFDVQNEGLPALTYRLLASLSSSNEEFKTK